MSSAVSPRSVQAAATSAGVRDGSSSRRAAGERVDTPAMSSATSATDRPPAASNASAIRAAHRASSAFSSRYAPKPPGSGGASTGTHPHRSRKPAHAFRTRTRSCSVTPSCAWAVAVNRRNRSGSALLRPVACAPVRRRCRARKVAVTGVGLIGAAVGSGSKAAALASSRGSHAAAMPTRVCSRSAARFRQAASSDRRWRSCEAWCRAIRTWSARSSRACARRTRSSYSTVLAVSKSRAYPPSKSRSAASAALRRGHALPRSASAACAAHAASRAAAPSSNPNPTSHPHHQTGNVENVAFQTNRQGACGIRPLRDGRRGCSRPRASRPPWSRPHVGRRAQREACRTTERRGSTCFPLCRSTRHRQPPAHGAARLRRPPATGHRPAASAQRPAASPARAARPARPRLRPARGCAAGSPSAPVPP